MLADCWLEVPRLFEATHGSRGCKPFLVLCVSQQFCSLHQVSKENLFDLFIHTRPPPITIVICVYHHLCHSLVLVKTQVPSTLRGRGLYPGVKTEGRVTLRYLMLFSPHQFPHPHPPGESSELATVK